VVDRRDDAVVESAAITELAAHSKLGASSSDRWMTCPGSVRLSRGIHSLASIYAAEGTAAHEIAARCLKTDGQPYDWIGHKLEVEGRTIEVTEEMADAVAEYLRTVRADYAEFEERPQVWTEHKFHLKTLHEDLYGTADRVHHYAEQRFLRIFDYKHGAGVAVEVDNNSQLMYYALGALLDLKVAVEYVELVIVQPRCPHPDGSVRRHKFMVIDLLDFRADLLDAVARTEAADAPLVAGDHCRWCPAAGLPCPELEAKAQQTARDEFALVPVANTDVTTFDAERMARFLAWAPTVEHLIESARQFAYAQAMRGVVIPGWKLVEKRATRKWTDEEQLVEYMKKAEVDPETLYEKKIKSPAQVEKLLGKKQFAPIAKQFVKKESSGNTLAPESDEREAVRVLTAQEEFVALDGGC
jgi:Protein of unknown function (DUF2800)